MHQDPATQPPANDPLPLPPPPELAPLPFAEPWGYEIHFPRDPRGPRVARIALRAVLASHGLDELTERAELLATELATNAVRHTAGPASLHLDWTCPALRVSVRDRSPGLTFARGGVPGGPHPLPPQDAIDGRGLLLLDVLADRWDGCALGDGPWGPGGKTIWFELLWEGKPPPALAA
ncbi:ATP-binding protein [Streptomyces sp. ACA25]|uniref:ATP-binding protein n=1 Tax=Streptomyces sp. ACA25 TaxID=3022596 RepID=UPI002307A261|nr:ATP-binding protein [Streptomyces sp. ACA25]MDB1086590.1 ATP-binding protein [Streptomyces sp. ACA25]